MNAAVFHFVFRFVVHFGFSLGIHWGFTGGFGVPDDTKMTIGTKPEPSLNQNHANKDRTRPRGFRNTRACTDLSRTGAEPRLNQN